MPTIDPAQPMSIGAAVAIIGVALTWILGGIAIWRFVLDKRKQQREDAARLKELIAEVCKSFTESEGYQLRRDRAMIAVAESVTSEAFRIRAGSFVDAAVDAERRTQMERRIAAVENAVSDLRTDFAVAAAQIAKEVVKEMRESQGIPS